MSGIDIGAILSKVEVRIAIGVVIFICVMALIGTSQSKDRASKQRPEGTDIKLAERTHERNSSPVWRDMPVAISSETITRELGWPLERYKFYQDNQRREVLVAVPDFGNELHPEEIILRRVQFQYYLEAVHNWSIILTDKRMLYKFEEKNPPSSGREGATTLQWVASHWYSNIVEVKPEWRGDLGSHIQGGGGYVYGWVWNGTGNTWGSQNPIQTVQHHIDCFITIKERNGEWQKFPFRNIYNENSLNATRDFISMLDKLVNLAWGK